jgi:hypothetical protein
MAQRKNEVKVCTCGHHNSCALMNCTNCGKSLFGVQRQVVKVCLADTRTAVGPVLRWSTTERVTPIGDNLLIGRDEPAPADLAAWLETRYTNISRRHAEIRCKDGKVTIMDLGSTNGTFLNGTPLPPNQEIPVGNGDVVRFAADASAIVEIP